MEFPWDLWRERCEDVPAFAADAPTQGVEDWRPAYVLLGDI